MKNYLIIALVALLSGLLVEQTSAQDSNIVAEGARLWANNCTRCHNARSPLERNDREWLTIMNHMRARANLTKTEAAAITAYLQMVNLQEGNNSTTSESVPDSSTGLKKSISIKSDLVSEQKLLQANGRISVDDLESLKRLFSHMRTRRL
ncbi:MAG: hypothetical protein IH951_06925 [Bacteroidetes bacterium]|nr:hypothetical protein [Bacteroidota bacterium]